MSGHSAPQCPTVGHNSGSEPDPETYSTEEVADLFAVSRKTIYRLLRMGGLPISPFKVGRQWRFPAAQVDALVADGQLSGATTRRRRRAAGRRAGRTAIIDAPATELEP